jgi:hypothetical protein
LLCRLALDSYECRERESVGNQGLCPTFKWRRNLPSFYRGYRIGQGVGSAFENKLIVYEGKIIFSHKKLSYTY